jgi:hypothetical protein
MNSIAKKITLSAGLGLLLLTGGCFDTKEDFTLNPDGSGKVVHECTFQALNLNNDADSQDAGKALTNAVRQVLEQAHGVEAWRDVTFKTLDDGRLHFRGTAYFKDISKLDIPNQMMLKFDWKQTADGHALLTLRTNADEPDGGMKMTIKKPAKPAKVLTPEEQSKKIKLERGHFQQAMPMLAGLMGNMKQAVVFRLPGKVVSSANFTNDVAGNLAINFDGAKMLAVMQKLVNDDAWCQAHGGTGFDDMQQKPVMDADVNQFVFGEKAPVSATVAVTAKPLFDYAAEVAAAQTEYAQTKKALRVGSSSSSSDDAEEVTAAPATGGLKSVKVVGVRLVREADAQRGLRPFNEEASYSVSLLVEFPGAVQSVSDETVLEAATADDGTDLLPDSDWNRKVHFPNLAKDKTAAILEFKLNLPGGGVKGLKELSGKVQYRVSGGTKEIDLGLDGLKEGATGTNLDAEIKSIKEGWQKNGSQEMSLHLKTNPDGLKSVSLVADGARTVLSQRGYGGGNGAYDFNYECKTNFPANGRIVAEVYDKVQTFEAPFKLENLTLLGISADGKN